MPAILRGFFDKVMLIHSAYNVDSEGVHPVRNIQRTVLLTTSTKKPLFWRCALCDQIMIIVQTAVLNNNQSRRFSYSKMDFRRVC